MRKILLLAQSFIETYQYFIKKICSFKHNKYFESFFLASEFYIKILNNKQKEETILCTCDIYTLKFYFDRRIVSISFNFYKSPG